MDIITQNDSKDIENIKCSKILYDYAKCIVNGNVECNIVYDKYKECQKKKEKPISWIHFYK